VRCSVLQWVQVRCSELCSALQCVAVRLQAPVSPPDTNVLQCVAVCCSVLQCVAVSCSELQ